MRRVNAGKWKQIGERYERQAGINFIGKGGLIQLAVSEWAKR